MIIHSLPTVDFTSLNPAHESQSTMASPLLLRQFLLHGVGLHNYQRFTAGTVTAPHRRWCRAAAANLPSEQEDEKVGSAANTSNLMRAKDPLSYSRWNDPDYRKWKGKEEEILRDVEAIVTLTKDILHSPRYKDGEQLTLEDEKAIVEKLLAYHPHSEDKIGCGLDSIMVDRHPQFVQSRCLFVVRTDGSWIDFSYQKCLREYIRDKYPTHGERFVREHFKRGSG